MKVIEFEIGQVKIKQENRGLDLLTSSEVFTSLGVGMKLKRDGFAS